MNPRLTDEQPDPEYGEWTRGNMGEVGRTVKTWHRTPLGWVAITRWEMHPDEMRETIDRG